MTFNTICTDLMSLFIFYKFIFIYYLLYLYLLTLWDYDDVSLVRVPNICHIFLVIGKIYLDIGKFDIVTTSQVKFVIFEKKIKKNTCEASFTKVGNFQCNFDAIIWCILIP